MRISGITEEYAANATANSTSTLLIVLPSVARSASAVDALIGGQEVFSLFFL